MSWHHVVIIIAALGFVAFCGHEPACHDVMPQLSTLASGAIGGALGNALAKSTRGPKSPPG